MAEYDVGSSPYFFLLEEYCREDSFSRPRREHLRDQSYMNIVWSLKESKQTKANHSAGCLGFAGGLSLFGVGDKAGIFLRRHVEGLGGRQGTSLSGSDSNLPLGGRGKLIID